MGMITLYPVSLDLHRQALAALLSAGRREVSLVDWVSFCGCARKTSARLSLLISTSSSGVHQPTFQNTMTDVLIISGGNAEDLIGATLCQHLGGLRLAALPW